MPAPLPSAALVKKELLSNLRRVRSFMCLALLVGACIWFTAALWPERGAVSNAGVFARQLVMGLFLVMMCSAALFVPAFASSAIVIEKEQRTFDMLNLTLISPSGILTAKLLNTVGFFLILIIASMPVLGVVFFLVGVDWVELTQSFVLIFLTALSCAMVGILSSARFRKTFGAVVGAYVGMLLLMGAPTCLVALWALLLSFAGPIALMVPRVGPIYPVYFLASPIAALVVILQDGVTWWQFFVAALYHVVIIAICYCLTLRILRRPAEPLKVEPHKPIDDPAALRARRKTYPYYLIDPLRRKKPIEDNRNPMLVKELRWGLMNRAGALVRVFYVAIIVFLLAGAVTTFLGGLSESILPCLIAEMVLTVAVAPALMANVLTKEYEVGNMDMLRMTLLQPREIVFGKAFAGMVSVAPIVLAAVVSGLPLLASGLMRREWGLLFTGYATLAVCALVSLSLGLFASLLTRRTSMSVALSYLLSFAAFIGICLALIEVGDHFIRAYGSRDVVWAAVCFFSPIMAFVFKADPPTSKLPLSTLCWVASMVAFTLFSIGLIMVCIHGFARFRMRDR